MSLQEVATNIRVLITDQDHPYCNRTGFLTGKILVSPWLPSESNEKREQINEVLFGDGQTAFVKRSQMKILAPFQTGETKKYIGINKNMP